MANPWPLRLTPTVAAGLPPFDEVLDYLANTGRPTVVDVLGAADLSGRPVVQPRCGVGDHTAMREMLQDLERAGPGILSLTIDSHTRLKQFAAAEQSLRRDPASLNGYPLLAHGWQRGRELAECVGVPLEVRHGSPDGRDLFATTLAAGITSFEGGGIGYNLPYSKNVSLDESLHAWQEVDAVCGELADQQVIIDRELFGTLTAVLVPPSISLAMTLLEAIAGSNQRVRCLSIAYPQAGEVHQDVAALRCIRVLAKRFLDADTEVFPVLHEFMGVFPKSAAWANGLILHGGLVARLGNATKVISKTEREAHGIPDAATNSRGIRTTSIGASDLFDFVRLDEDRIAEEMYWIEREVAEIVEPVLAGSDLIGSIRSAFRDGLLDIPFSASVHARSAVIPRRDRNGCIRYGEAGSLPFSSATLERNAGLLDGPSAASRGELSSLLDAVTRDIYYFAEQERRDVQPAAGSY